MASRRGTANRVAEHADKQPALRIVHLSPQCEHGDLVRAIYKLSDEISRNRRRSLPHVYFVNCNIVKLAYCSK